MNMHIKRMNTLVNWLITAQTENITVPSGILLQALSSVWWLFRLKELTDWLIGV